MALPGHSPPPFLGPGSPTRALNGHTEHSLPPPPPQMYGPPRPMLPPSPQNYQPRYPGPSGPSPSPSFPDSRIPPPPLPPQKRPDSSMSISSMLGGEPERPVHDPYQNHGPHTSSRPGSTSAPSMTLGAVMSPPQQPSRPAGMGDYAYKPRSQTPDRMGTAYSGSRQRSASSGTSMPPHPSFYDQHDHLSRNPPPRLGGPLPTTSFNGTPILKEEQSDRARRTSLSGILQRPSSQPQSSGLMSQAAQSFPSPAPTPGSHYLQSGMMGADTNRQNVKSNGYDTRPPGMGESRTNVHTSPPTQMQNLSPELRRSNVNGMHNRGLAGLLNGPTSQPGDSSYGTSQSMMRQDSTQSQSDRSTFGDRGRFRHYSPFAGSVASQHGSSGGVDEQGRKGSDEIAHKTIVGLGLDNRRGRYSPVPQAVQGAQAQSPMPDGGVRSEHGRVFSGIGGGIGVSSTAPTPVQGPLPASPFKRDASTALQNDDHPNKMARTASNLSKRMRKTQEDDGDVFESKKPKGNKRTKHQNSYKADLEEMANSGLQNRSMPFGGINSIRGTNTPINGGLPTNPVQRFDTTPIFKPKKTVKVASVMNSTLKKPRRHLGNFSYDPQILVPDTAAIGDPDFDICIRPKLLPAFTENEHLNCTYVVRVSRTWVQDVERRIICSTRNLWGTGIYSDDSDPLAAAMHMGWLKASHNGGVDEALLAKVVEEQNPKVDIAKDFNPPTKPLDIPIGQDLKITLVVMPQLEQYAESVRFGVRSRSWPEDSEKTPHDGMSFAILKVEFISIGPEERRSGRTGESKRKRLRAQIEARARAAQAGKERLESIAKKQADKKKKQLLEVKPERSQQQVEAPQPDELGLKSVADPVELSKAADLVNKPEVEEYRRQLATAAA